MTAEEPAMYARFADSTKPGGSREDSGPLCALSVTVVTVRRVTEMVEHACTRLCKHWRTLVHTCRAAIPTNSQATQACAD